MGGVDLLITDVSQGADVTAFRFVKTTASAKI
jgi:hypothetical protein